MNVIVGQQFEKSVVTTHLCKKFDLISKEIISKDSDSEIFISVSKSENFLPHYLFPSHCSVAFQIYELKWVKEKPSKILETVFIDFFILER
jgi:hypothetical protein